MAKKVGLALGGGAARGWAHIGVIKALEEAGIQVDYVAGTSIGSLIGGVYASGKLKELEAYALEMDWKKVTGNLDLVYFKNGLFDGEKLKKLLAGQFIKRTIPQAQIPFIAVATDLKTGAEVRIKSGNLVDAIRASVAIPGIFTPAKKGARYLVDGGLVNPMPVNVVRDMGADIVIAVDLNTEVAGIKPRFKSRLKKQRANNPVLQKMEKALLSVQDDFTSKVNAWLKKKWPTLFDVIGNSINIMQHKITEENLLTDSPEFLIRTKLGYVQLFDFHLAEQVIDHGYQQAKKQIGKIKKMVNA